VIAEDDENRQLSAILFPIKANAELSHEAKGLK
jgi:hypothetical protein